jgi:YHS domain-containing protein/thioredoxin-related protein
MIIRPSRQRLPARCQTLALGVLLAIAAAPAALSSETETIAWRDDYGSALDEAKAANRLLWIQFTGPWCPNCTRMERDSFPDPVVVQHARESFVPLRLRSDVHEQLAHNFNLTGLPATIIVAPNLEVVAVHQGYLGPADFDAFLRESISRAPAKPASVEKATDRSHAQAQATAGGDDAEKGGQLALDGYCVVSLIRQGKLVAGQSAYTVRHAGRTYRFASSEMYNSFRQEPDRYVPANNGSCPVTQLDRGKVQPGSPKWGILYKSHLFLFASEEDRRRFVKAPDRYAMVDVAEQGFCIHCIRESGLLVRGDPRHEVALEGRRYWFPDGSHRDAFVTSLR